MAALYYQWRDKQPKETADAAEEFQAEICTSERAADASNTLEEAEETAWKEIEEYIQAINPYDLQKLVAALLRAMGYHIARISPRGPDKGVDILAHDKGARCATPMPRTRFNRLLIEP
jgi:restriction system protein